MRVAENPAKVQQIAWTCRVVSCFLDATVRFQCPVMEQDVITD